MKLDPRIIENKKPLSCFDTEEAEKFIGKECYFCDCPLAFEDLDKFTTLVKSVLVRIQDTEKPFLTGAIACFSYAYCLPFEWVQEKEPEPVWKPYDLDTWRNDGFRIGSAITFRIKPKNEQDSKNTIVKTMVYLGREEHSDNLNDIYIYIGTIGYSFKYLFENHEIFDDKYTKPGCSRWRPFGYQE